MSERTVHSQAELDQAIADRIDLIKIDSPASAWLTITDLQSSRVVARGSSRVVARESSRVEAWESSSVEAREFSRVVARGSSSVEAWESSSVVARESSSVEARESSRVEAWGSSSVVARESSSVVASESTTVQAHRSAKIKAAPLVAVMLHSATVDVQGGVVIDHSKVDDMDGAEWCAYHGVEVERGVATLFKAVNDQWTTERGTDYSPGSLPSCDDFRDTNACGNGLHFGPTPRHAHCYYADATHFLAVGVDVSTLRPITTGVPKAKAPRVVRACVEVDIDGKPIDEASA